jgi:hypothetical protein
MGVLGGGGREGIQLAVVIWVKMREVGDRMFGGGVEEGAFFSDFEVDAKESKAGSWVGRRTRAKNIFMFPSTFAGRHVQETWVGLFVLRTFVTAFHRVCDLALMPCGWMGWEGGRKGVCVWGGGEGVAEKGKKWGG